MPDTEREKVYAQDALSAQMKAIRWGLEEKYDVITSGDVVMADELRNSVTVTLKRKYGVYKNRFYGEGDGSYHINSNLEVYENTHLKFGKVKTDEETASKEQCFFLFKKGMPSEAKSAFNVLSCRSEKYFTVKSIKNAKRPVTNGAFRFYVAMVAINLITVLAFVASMIYGFIRCRDTAESVLSSTLGGVVTPWVLFAVSVVLAVAGAIYHEKKVEPFRPTGNGKGHVHFSVHCVFIAGVQLLTIIFAALVTVDNFIAYLLSFLFYPVCLVCVIYPLVMIIFLGISGREFSVSNVEYLKVSLTDGEYNMLQAAEQKVRAAAASVNIGEIREIIIRNISSDTEFSVH